MDGFIFPVGYETVSKKVYLQVFEMFLAGPEVPKSDEFSNHPLRRP